MSKNTNEKESIKPKKVSHKLPFPEVPEDLSNELLDLAIENIGTGNAIFSHQEKPLPENNDSDEETDYPPTKGEKKE